MDVTGEATLFSAFAGSLAVSLALTPPLMAVAGRLRVMDLPGARRIHAAPVARVGGLALAAGGLLSALVWAPKHELVVWYLIGALLIMALGAWDDRADLDFRVKFVVQTVAAGLVVGLGGLRLETLPFWDGGALPLWLSAPLTVVVLLGVTNAVNLSDGLDGLAGGLCLLTFGGLAYLAHLADDWTTLIIAVSVLGGLVGFLRFNTYPARVFMGDGGSQFLGFSAGVLAVLLIRSHEPTGSPILAALIVGLPLLDTMGVMGQRLAEGRSPFLPDNNHVHHKLLTAGLFHHEAVIAIYALQATMVTSAFVLREASDGMVLAVYLAIALPVLAAFLLPGRGRLRWRRAEQGSAPPITTIRWAGRWVGEVPLHLLGVGVAVFLASSVFLPRTVPVDFGVMAALVFGVVALGMAVFRNAAPLLARVGLYIAGSFVLYLCERGSLFMEWPLRPVLNVFFVVIAILVLLAIRSRRAEFEITPMDYLLVFLALLIPYLPFGSADSDLGLLAPKLLVLFFAYEVVLGAQAERTARWGAVSLWVLLGLGVRAWW